MSRQKPGPKAMTHQATWKGDYASTYTVEVREDKNHWISGPRRKWRKKDGSPVGKTRGTLLIDTIEAIDWDL